MKPFRKLGRRFSRHAMLIVVTFVAIVAGGTVAWWGFPPSALAATHDCGVWAGYQGRYHTSAANNVGMQGIHLRV